VASDVDLLGAAWSFIFQREESGGRSSDSTVELGW